MPGMCSGIKDFKKPLTLTPIVYDIQLQIGMKASCYRAGITGTFQDEPFFFFQFQSIRKIKNHVNLPDAPGITKHVLGDGDSGPAQLDMHIGCFQRHGGDHASGKGDADRISGTETFSLTPVVGWGVGFNDCATLQVCAFTPELTFIDD